MKLSIAEKRQIAKFYKKHLTPSERMMWWQLRGNRLGMAWGRQVRFCGYILDFACFEAKLCVEVDGAVHAHRESYDNIRDYRLLTRGWRTLRFKTEDVYERMPWVLSRICEAMGVNDVGVRPPTAKQKRRTAVRIAGDHLRTERNRFNSIAERPKDMRPRLVKPEAASGATAGITR